MELDMGVLWTEDLHRFHEWRNAAVTTMKIFFLSEKQHIFSRA